LLTAALLGVALGAAALYFFNPAVSAFYPPCPFNALTDRYCPGCGTLRGLNLLLHGDPVGAFGSNPLMMLALPFVVVALALRAWAVLAGKPYRSHRVPARWIWGLLAVIMLYWVLRNIPVHPFTLMAP
jgi:hypothetical protein